VEVLAALLLIAIVLPAVMKGIALSTNAGNDAKRRTEAVGLAQSKLNELVATESWQGVVLQGDFGTDSPGYTWDASVQAWPGDSTSLSIQQIDVHVKWQSRNREDSVTLSTLAYVRE
jgi:type II secretory pathway pseudopilin PulG